MRSAHSLCAVAGAAGEELWLGRRRSFLCGFRPTLPPVPDVAFAASTGTMVPPCPRRYGSRPLIQALIRRVPCDDLFSRLNALHALAVLFESLFVHSITVVLFLYWHRYLGGPRLKILKF